MHDQPNWAWRSINYQQKWDTLAAKKIRDSQIMDIALQSLKGPTNSQIMFPLWKKRRFWCKSYSPVSDLRRVEPGPGTRLFLKFKGVSRSYQQTVSIPKNSLNHCQLKPQTPVAIPAWLNFKSLHVWRTQTDHVGSCRQHAKSCFTQEPHNPSWRKKGSNTET